MKTFLEFADSQRFRIAEWSSQSDIIKIVVDGDVRSYRFRSWEEIPQCVQAVRDKWDATHSVSATLKELDKYAVPISLASKRHRYVRPTKMVRCDHCGYETPISGNPPGTRCPNCEEGELHVFD
jgi:predicted Zn-ribbon and HTH transcriptional regulator